MNGYLNEKSTKDQKSVNRSDMPIITSSKNTDGKTICDEKIKEYIWEIIEFEGLCYGYYKITIILKRKYINYVKN